MSEPPPQQTKPGRWSTAWKAARGAGWGAESDGLVKLVTFVVVLGIELLPGGWRRGRPPIAIDAVRLGAYGGDAHMHVVDVRCTDGVVRPVREVIFGLRYRREVYVTGAENGDAVNIMVSRCRLCGQDALSTELDDNFLLSLRRF